MRAQRRGVWVVLAGLFVAGGAGCQTLVEPDRSLITGGAGGQGGEGQGGDGQGGDGQGGDGKGGAGGAGGGQGGSGGQGGT